MAKPALGKGLGALINTRVAAPAPVEELGERIQVLPLDQITTSPFQPREEFRNELLQELVESIRERGIIQPLIVRRVGDKYELIAGERRWRAARELRPRREPAARGPESDRRGRGLRAASPRFWPYPGRDLQAGWEEPRFRSQRDETTGPRSWRAISPQTRADFRGPRQGSPFP